MTIRGTWTPWSTGRGYSLNLGQSFSGEVHKGDDGWWQTALNGRRLGSFRDCNAAFDRVEYEITTLMRLAMEDLTAFRPKRPSQV